jgi:Protein of unknown function, DUF547
MFEEEVARRRAGSVALVLAAALALLATACGAPKAAPLGGDIGSVLSRGIAEGRGTFDHSLWDELVFRHQKREGRRFDYVGLKRDQERFRTYLDSLARADLASLSGVEIEALFINAYNALTIRTVLDRVSEDGTFQIESIRDIDDVFGRKVHVVGGYHLSLDDIEHGILRPTFRDPRIHFAVNCASMSCPPLPVHAFRGDAIDEELEAAATSALGNPDYATVDSGELLLTKILDWYGSDFVNPDYRGSENTVAAFVRKYANEDVRRFIAEHEASGDGNVPVRFRDYDWRLNRTDR